MKKLVLICSAITIAIGAVGLTGVLSYDITMPLMFLFLGLTMLASAKEKYDKGSKQQAKLFLGMVVVIYAILGYNLFTMVLGH